jgi:dTDP-4-dehydrorhamnose 3,5-epimerase
MKFNHTSFDGLYEIHPLPLEDERGFFMRTFDIKLFSSSIPSFQGNFVQVNHSSNKFKHTWRGLHLQRFPFEESKFIRCVKGKIIDVVVDVRKDSATYLKSFQIELSEENKIMLYIPKGFAHGFLTLEDNCEVIYMVDEFYNPNSETGIRYDDKSLDLKLPFKPKIISKRDISFPDFIF